MDRGETCPVPIAWVVRIGFFGFTVFLLARVNTWMAAVIGEVLLVKTWLDVPLASIPPKQGEVQVYLQTNPGLAEMEEMGPWTGLAPGSSLIWTVRRATASELQRVNAAGRGIPAEATPSRKVSRMVLPVLEHR